MISQCFSTGIFFIAALAKSRVRVFGGGSRYQMERGHSAALSINRLEKYHMKTLKPLPLLASILVGTMVGLTAFARDGADISFHDDLLDHLVGQWEISAVAHGRPTDQGVLVAEWVLNHQFLKIYQKGTANVPGMNSPFEGMYFIGFDHANKRYLTHLVCVWGGDDPTEGLSYGSRTGNELKLVWKTVREQPGIVQRFTWEPDSKSWHIVSRMVNAGKEEEPFLDIKVTAANPLRSEGK
jgi:hypothetical protein